MRPGVQIRPRQELRSASTWHTPSARPPTRYPSTTPGRAVSSRSRCVPSRLAVQLPGRRQIRQVAYLSPASWRTSRPPLSGVQSPALRQFHQAAARLYRSVRSVSRCQPPTCQGRQLWVHPPPWCAPVTEHRAPGTTPSKRPPSCSIISSGVPSIAPVPEHYTRWRTSRTEHPRQA